MHAYMCTHRHIHRNTHTHRHSQVFYSLLGSQNVREKVFVE